MRRTASAPSAPHPTTPEPTALELHSGIVLGDLPVRDLYRARRAPAGDSPRRVLEDVVGRSMRAGPCVVSFSGGRDSSLVLAIAAHLARRDGLDPPTAVTMRYPGVPRAEETDWQDLVIERLQVPHEVVEVPPTGNDLAGPLAVGHLVRSGPSLPPTSGAFAARLAPVVAGRTVLTGQGGDEVLGESRVSPFVAHWRRRRKPDAASVRAMAEALLPRPVRRVTARHELRRDARIGWLTDPARREVTRGLVEAMTDEPWDWRATRWRVSRSRLWLLGSAHLHRAAALEGFTLVDPLLDPGFVTAMADHGGRLGLATRTEAMRLLADDLLPLRLLRRASKATFENVFAGAPTRDFARSWDGSGVDTALVDVERLRAAWLSPEIPVASMAPLQLALLAAVDQGWTPPATPDRAA